MAAFLVSPYVPKNAVFQEPQHGPTNTSQFELSSVPATAKGLFGLPAYLTRRDAWAGSFAELLSLDAPRTDCPMTLPAPPRGTAVLDSPTLLHTQTPSSPAAEEEQAGEEQAAERGRAAGGRRMTGGGAGPSNRDHPPPPPALQCKQHGPVHAARPDDGECSRHAPTRRQRKLMELFSTLSTVRPLSGANKGSER
jgi:hypothetical protein